MDVFKDAIKAYENALLDVVEANKLLIKAEQAVRNANDAVAKAVLYLSHEQ